MPIDATTSRSFRLSGGDAHPENVSAVVSEIFHPSLCEIQGLRKLVRYEFAEVQRKFALKNPELVIYMKVFRNDSGLQKMDYSVFDGRIAKGRGQFVAVSDRLTTAIAMPRVGDVYYAIPKCIVAFPRQTDVKLVYTNDGPVPVSIHTPNLGSSDMREHVTVTNLNSGEDLRAEGGVWIMAPDVGRHCEQKGSAAVEPATDDVIYSPGKTSLFHITGLDGPISVRTQDIVDIMRARTGLVYRASRPDILR